MWAARASRTEEISSARRVGRGGAGDQSTTSEGREGWSGRSEHDIRGRTFPGRSAQAGDALGLGRDIWRVIEVNVDKYDRQKIYGLPKAPRGSRCRVLSLCWTPKSFPSVNYEERVCPQWSFLLAFQNISEISFRLLWGSMMNSLWPNVFHMQPIDT